MTKYYQSCWWNFN